MTEIIVPLDISTLREQKEIMDLLPEVNIWKVGLQLFLSEGFSSLEIIKNRGKKIFLDLKLLDIPNTIKEACKIIVTFDIDFFTLHSTNGVKGLEECVKELENIKKRPKLIGVTLLTSFNQRELGLLDIEKEINQYILNRALDCKKIGLDGVVCSAKEAKEIRKKCGEDFNILCPGIRPRDYQKDDQERVMTPLQASLNGADYLIIGRPIFNSISPHKTFLTLYNQLNDNKKVERKE